MGQIEQLGQGQEVVLAVAVAFLPFLALFIAAAVTDALPGAFFSFVLPDAHLYGAVADLMYWLARWLIGHDRILVVVEKANYPSTLRGRGFPGPVARCPHTAVPGAGRGL